VPSISAVRVGPDAAVCSVDADGGVVIAAFAEGTDADRICALFISTDGAATWSRSAISFQAAVTAPAKLESVSAVAIHRGSGGLLVGTTNGRILRSDGPDKPWRTVFQAPTGTFQPVVGGFSVPTSAVGGTIYAALKGILRSDDGGRTWRDVTAGIGDLPAQMEKRTRFDTAGPVQDGDRVIVGIGGLQPGATGLWISADGSPPWRRSTGAPGTGERGLAAHGGFIVVALPAGTDASGRPTVTALASRDGGSSWQPADAGIAANSITRLIDAQVGAVGIAAAAGNVVFALQPDLSWKELFRVPAVITAFGRSATNLYVGTEQGLYRGP
jgi:hypothetical protein